MTRLLAATPLLLLLAACDGDSPPATMAACGEATLLETPEDPGEPGPWAVGALTTTVGRLTVEVWYPAPADSVDVGAAQVRYDVREALPPSEREAIPDADNPWQVCDCYRALPLDAERGPYPVVVFIHGTASFRTQSLTQVEHWTSRGFVVVAANHPGLMLGDTLTVACPDEASGSRDLAGDVDALLAALADPAGDLAFLAGHLDPDRVGLVGHSAGGAAVSQLADRPGVRVVVPMASTTPPVESDTLEETLFLAGTADAIVPAAETEDGFEAADGPRRLGVLDGAPHLAFSDLCTLTADDGRNLVDVAQAYEVCGTEFASLLFDCAEATLDFDRAADVVTWLSTAVLEQHLQCRDRSAALDGAAERFRELETWRTLPE
ncbi:MAG: alpha/beta hydrolase family protein [Myxococcota bacterium]